MHNAKRQFNGTLIQLLLGDITRQEVDAIVNAANQGLRGGGGVDGAIHRAGGPSIMDECIEIRKLQGGCPTGEAVITGAGNLKAKYVIHAVGPRWRDGQHGEAELLYGAFANSLKLAAENEVRSIAFPAISTGVYSYPLEEAAQIAIKAVFEFCKQPSSILDIRFVLFDQSTYDAFAGALNQA